MRAEVKETKYESERRKGKPSDLCQIVGHGRSPTSFIAVFECLDPRARSVAIP